MNSLNKSGYIVKKKFISIKNLSVIEKNILLLINRKCQKTDKEIYLKTKKILKLKGKKFRDESIKILEYIEKKNKKLFYEVSSNFENIYSINNIDQNKKSKNFLKSYFRKSYYLIQRRSPILLFNKKNLDRLKYHWHQESKFYPQHDIGLHMWFPIYRNVDSKNDGGMCFAKNGNKQNYKYKEFKKNNSWTQRVPKLNVEKEFKVVTPKVNRGDVVFFEAKQLHKSDNQENTIPRVSLVIRYLSNSKTVFNKI